MGLDDIELPGERAGLLRRNPNAIGSRGSGRNVEAHQEGGAKCRKLPGRKRPCTAPRLIRVRAKLRAKSRPPQWPYAPEHRLPPCPMRVVPRARYIVRTAASTLPMGRAD